MPLGSRSRGRLVVGAAAGRPAAPHARPRCVGRSGRSGPSSARARDSDSDRISGWVAAAAAAAHPGRKRAAAARSGSCPPPPPRADSDATPREDPSLSVESRAVTGDRLFQPPGTGGSLALVAVLEGRRTPKRRHQQPPGPCCWPRPQVPLLLAGGACRHTFEEAARRRAFRRTA